MPASSIISFNSATASSSHAVSLAGKSTARDLLALILTTATPTLPDGWVEEGAYLGAGGAYLVRLWHLPASLNTSFVTTLTIALSASRAVGAIVWEDDVDQETPGFVFEPVAQGPNGSDPALWGTGVHTFSTRSEVFAFYVMSSQSGGDLGTFDIVSYDLSFTDFGDTGKSGGVTQVRAWAARRSNFAAAGDGVTATANGTRPGSSDLGPTGTGVLAYQTGLPLPPTPVLRRAPASLVFAYELGGDPPNQGIQVKNSGGGGTLDWSATSNVAWATINPASGTGVIPGVPATPTVTINPSGLSPGSYSGVVEINATGTDLTGSPQTIPVSMAVTAQNLDYAPQDWERIWRVKNGSVRRLRDAVEGATSPERHGARGDGTLLTDVAITIDTTQLDSTSASFKSGDVGKWVKIRGAGLLSQGSEMVAQIASVTSPTRVQLDRPAAQTVSNAITVYGTDDTQAWRDAIEQLHDDGLASGSYSGKLIVPPRHFVLASEPILGGPWSVHAQIPLPYLPSDGPKFVLSIQGPGDGSHFYHWRQNVIRGGAVLHSFLLDQHIDFDHGVPSVIGGPNGLDLEPDNTAPFSNLLVYIDGISVLCPRDPSLIGIDLVRCAQANIGTLSINADGTPVGGNLNAATNDQGMALRMPAFQNNDNTNIFSFASEGFFYGIQIADHFTAQRLAIIYSNTAVYCAPGGGPEHGTFIGYMSVEACQNGLVSNGSVGGKYPVFIARMDIEVFGGGFTFTDHNDTLYGTVHYAHNGSAPPTFATKPGGGLGGRNLVVIDDNVSRGSRVLTGGEIPASGAAAGVIYRDREISVAGGTLTAVTVDGITKSGVPRDFRVPAGMPWSITYTGTPAISQTVT